MLWGEGWGEPWGGGSQGITQILTLVQSEVSAVVVGDGITIKEQVPSRNLQETSEGRRLTRIFVITGTDDPPEAGGLGPQIGDTYDASIGDSGGTETDTSLIATSRALSPLAVDTTIKAIKLVVEYGEADLTPSGLNRQVSLDITGESTHIERAISQTHFPTSRANDLDDEWGKIIGPKNKEGEIVGADKLDTKVSYAETHFRNRLSTSYIVTLLTLHGKVNTSIFRGFAAKTILFEGVNARRLPNGQWELSYKFSIAPFAVESRFDDFIKDDGTTETDNVLVSGHQFLWLDVVESKNATSGELEKKLRSAHVADIYDDADFGALDIGTNPLTN